MDVFKPKLVGNDDRARPTREEAMDAVRTLIAWAGDDPERPGLVDTPRRVVDAYSEWFEGYGADPARELSRVFEDVTGYDDMVILRQVEVESHCEHHIAPFLGRPRSPISRTPRSSASPSWRAWSRSSRAGSSPRRP